MKTRFLILLGGFFAILLTQGLYGQNSPTYELNFVKAKFTSTKGKKDVVAVFQILPKDDKNFPPILSMGLTYSIGEDGPEKRIDIMKSENQARITIHDHNIKQRDSALYDFIKDNLLENDDRYLILAIYLDNISKKDFNKMTITYGLWEKNNPSVREEKRFEFTVEE